LKCVTHRQEIGATRDEDGSQKRTQAQLEYNAFLAGCPSRQLVDRISDKWVVLILGALGGGGSAQPAAPDAPKGCATPRSLLCWSGSARRC